MADWTCYDNCSIRWRQSSIVILLCIFFDFTYSLHKQIKRVSKANYTSVSERFDVYILKN